MTNFQIITNQSSTLAYQLIQGSSTLPPIIFLTGFKSDMMGSKAEYLAHYCIEHNRTFLRFDFFGHGQSNGDFIDFTLSHAINDAIFMINTLIKKPAIIVGSSMGGWVGLRLMELIPNNIFGLIGIAAAPDFTAEIKSQLTPNLISDLNTNGFFEQESDYEEPYIFTKKLLDDGDQHCVLDRVIQINKPVHLLQGKVDNAVPWDKANRINKTLNGNATITFIDDGDHSLSRPQDLEILKSAIEEMAA
jgi:pimeloyl-ACP methyl ester carboxylesterase